MRFKLYANQNHVEPNQHRRNFFITSSTIASTNLDSGLEHKLVTIKTKHNLIFNKNSTQKEEVKQHEQLPNVP